MRKTASLLALTGLFVLSACDWGKKRDEEVLPLDNMTDEVVNDAADGVPEAEPVDPAPINASNAALPVVPPPPPVSEEQQTLDDADATGMTSRLPEEDVPSDPGF